MDPRKGCTVTERGFFTRITDTVSEKVREGVESVEDKVKGTVTAMTDKVKNAVQTKVQEYQRAALSFGLAGVLSWLAVLALVAAAVLGLSEWFHPAVAAVIVAGALLLLATILGLYGKSTLPAAPDPDQKEVTPALRQQDEGVDHFWTD